MFKSRKYRLYSKILLFHMGLILKSGWIRSYCLFKYLKGYAFVFEILNKAKANKVSGARLMKPDIRS